MKFCSSFVDIVLVILTAICAPLAISLVARSQGNEPPVASFTFSPSQPSIGEEIMFDASSSYDPDGIITSYEWDFNDDGAIDKSGPLVSYRFHTPGEHIVRLIVIDNEGLSSVFSQSLTIQVRPSLGTGILSLGLGAIFTMRPSFLRLAHLNGMAALIVSDHIFSLSTLGYSPALFGRAEAWVIGSSVIFNKEAWEMHEISRRLQYNPNSLFWQKRFFGVTLYRSSQQEHADWGETYTISGTGVVASVGHLLRRDIQFTLENDFYWHRTCFANMGCGATWMTNVVTVSLISDNRNDYIFPSEGGLRSISLQQAGAFTAGIRFTKLMFTIVQYLPAGKGQNMAFRLDGGVGFSLPNGERFTLGGVNAVRGIPALRTDKLVLGSLEYQARLLGGVAMGVLFLDLGLGEYIALQGSCGLELRVVMPHISQVRFILSWPFIGDEGGWQPRLDLSIGYSF